jgi:membrane protein
MGVRDAVEWLKPLWETVTAYTEDLRRHDALRAASAIAFDAFFSLVPLVAISGWLAHELTDSNTRVLEPLLGLVPEQVAVLADEGFMRLSAGGDAVLPPLSIGAFLWLSSGGVATAMRVFERIFEAEDRPWLRRRLLSFGFVLGAVTVLGLSTSLIVYTMFLGDGGSWITGIVTPAVVLYLLTVAFFRYGIRRAKGTRRSAFRGAAVTLVLWAAVSLFFSMYVRQLASYSQFYGGLAAVVVLLLWLWLMAFALLVGGEINARLEGVRS